ncbi:hypothetical protein PRJ39_24970 [Lysobacter enzymogenes]|uniref:hypothetical protein n=1 Tax=Lysobacter enzymogenes TaxID=69 RepID=UPI00374801CD
MISAKDQLTDCLRGMPEHERIWISQLDEAAVSIIAEAELERRAAEVFQRFSIETLAGLMAGDIDMREALASAAAR